MKFIASAALVLLLGGCYAVPVAPPPPRPVVYAPAPAYYYETPAYAYPAYGGYYGPNVNLNFGSRGGYRRW